MRVAAVLYDQGIGTAIINNDASELYVVVEPPKPRERVLLRGDELDAILAPAGALSTRYGGYEDRPGQRDMLAAIVAVSTRAAFRSSRPVPARESRWRTWCPPCAGRRRTPSGRWSPQIRSTSRNSWRTRTCPWYRASWGTCAGLSSKGGVTTSRSDELVSRRRVSRASSRRTAATRCTRSSNGSVLRRTDHSLIWVSGRRTRRGRRYEATPTSVSGPAAPTSRSASTRNPDARPRRRNCSW